MFKRLRNYLNRQSIIQSVSMNITLTIFVFIVVFYIMFINNYWEKEALNRKCDLVTLTSRLQAQIQAQEGSIAALKRDGHLSRSAMAAGIRGIVEPVINQTNDANVEYYDPELGLTIENNKGKAAPFTADQKSGADPSVITIRQPVYAGARITGYLSAYVKTEQLISAGFYEGTGLLIIIMLFTLLILFFVRKYMSRLQYFLDKYCRMIISDHYEAVQVLHKLPELKPVLDRLARYIAEIKEQREGLARLERLNLIGQMAAGISHEIRNPLTTVKGFLQFLSLKNDNNQDKEYLDLMIGEIDRANSIITDFLSLAKVNLEDTAPNNLNAIVRKLYPMLQADAYNLNKEVVLELQELPDLLLSENEIRQLILNLTRNGLEVTPEHGTVSISTFLRGDKAVLAIKDQGPGIPPEIQAKIGTPFFTTKENGTGLGLAISIGIAQRHHAAFQFESGDSGTTFLISFSTQEEANYIS